MSTPIPTAILADRSPIKPYVTGQPLDPRVQFVLDELRAILNGKIEPVHLMAATFQGVRLLEQFKLEGAQKKATLSAALRALIDLSDMSFDDKAACNMVLDLHVAEAIDNFVFAMSGLVSSKGCSSVFCCFRP